MATNGRRWRAPLYCGRGCRAVDGPTQRGLGPPTRLAQVVVDTTGVEPDVAQDVFDLIMRRHEVRDRLSAVKGPTG